MKKTRKNYDDYAEMCGNCAFLLRGHWAKMLYEIAQVCWPFAELWRPGFSPPYFSYFYIFLWILGRRRALLHCSFH